MGSATELRSFFTYALGGKVIHHSLHEVLLACSLDSKNYLNSHLFQRVGKSPPSTRSVARCHNFESCHRKRYPSK